MTQFTVSLNTWHCPFSIFERPEPQASSLCLEGSFQSCKCINVHRTSQARHAVLVERQTVLMKGQASNPVAQRCTACSTEKELPQQTGSFNERTAAASLYKTEVRFACQFDLQGGHGMNELSLKSTKLL